MKKTVIIDVDGTLYYQLPVRLCMLFSLIIYYVFHFNKIKELLFLKKYRHYHNSVEQIEKKYITNLANKYNLNINYAYKIINKWMIIKPLYYIKCFRDKKLIGLINNSNYQIIIYSDYPCIDKIKCLSIKYDYAYCSDDKFIGVLKPNYQGLNNIVKKHKLNSNNTYYIGDNKDKDGICAKKCNIKYYNVSKYSLIRHFQYRYFDFLD